MSGTCNTHGKIQNAYVNADGKMEQKKSLEAWGKWGPSDWILRCEVVKGIQLAQCRAVGIHKTTVNVLQG